MQILKGAWNCRHPAIRSLSQVRRPSVPSCGKSTTFIGLDTWYQFTGVIKNITDRGDEPGGGSAQDLAKMTEDQYKLWGEVARANNIKAD